MRNFLNLGLSSTGYWGKLCRFTLCKVARLVISSGDLAVRFRLILGRSQISDFKTPVHPE